MSCSQAILVIFCWSQHREIHTHLHWVFYVATTLTVAFIACLLHTPGCHQNRHNLSKEINHILVILIVLGKFCLSILGTACFSSLHHRLQKQEKLYFCTRKPKTKKLMCSCTHTHTHKYACGHVELIHFKTAMCIKFLFLADPEKCSH